MINDDGYLFFCAMEHCVQLNIELVRSYHGQNLKLVLTKTLTQSKHVLSNWDIVTKSFDLEEGPKEHPLLRIITYWINTRGNAFIKAWVDQNKKRVKLSMKGEYSLCKQVHTS